MNGKIVGMTEKPTGKARMPEQDIAKGIAILLVLALHTLTLKRSVYLVCGGIFGFIMPFFFFMAGYNHRPGRYTYRQIIKRRAKQILAPFFTYSIAITLIAGAYYMIAQHNTFGQVAQTYLTLLLTRPVATSLGIEYISGLFSCIMMFWFIEMLFSATLIFYAVADYALEKAPRLISVSAGLIVVTMIFAHFDLHLPFYLAEAPAIAAIMLLGAAFGQRGLLARHAGTSVIVANSVVGYAGFLTLAAMFQGSGLIVGGSLWNNTLREWCVPLTAFFAIAGSYAFVHFSRCLTKFRLLSRVLSWCGNNSMKLLFLHGIVQLFLCVILGMEPFRMSFSSQVNDYRTFYLLALEIAVTVLIIHVIGFTRKRIHN